MRIVHITDYSAPGFGAPKAIGDLCVAQAAAGHEVRLLIGQASPVPALSGVEASVMEELPESIPGYPLQTEAPLHNQLSEAFREWVCGYMEEFDPDIIHVHNLASLYAASPLSQPVMATLRGDIRASRQLEAWLALLPGCGFVQYFNPALASLLEEMEVACGWSCSGVKPVVLDPVKFKASPQLLWVGRLDDNRSPAHMLGALPTLLRVWPELRLAVLGDGALRGELQEHACSLGVNNYIDWLGWVERPANLMAGAQLALFGGERMGFDRAVMEALSLGTACLVTPALAPIVQGGELGWVCENSPDGWFRGVSSALRRGNDQKLLAAQQFACQNYSFSAALERTELAYQSLLA